MKTKYIKIGKRIDPCNAFKPLSSPENKQMWLNYVVRTESITFFKLINKSRGECVVKESP